MRDTIFLGLSTLASFVGWYVVISTYLWPILKRQSKQNSLKALLPIHFIRFIGTGFLITGVVAQALPAGFAVPAAYGDLIAMTLAYVAFSTLQWSASTKIQLTTVWIFNLVGTLDLLLALATGPTLIKHIGDLGATFFVVTVPVPLLLVTHIFIFRILLKHQVPNNADKNQRSELHNADNVGGHATL